MMLHEEKQCIKKIGMYFKSKLLWQSNQIQKDR